MRIRIYTSRNRLTVIVLVAAVLLAHRAEARRPDVVVILTDQQQGAAMGVAGVPGLRTPVMDSLALHGMRFTRAHTPTPQCSPARFALLTGRHPHRSGVMGNVAAGQRQPEGQSGPADASIPNLATVFSTAGYDTAYVGKWHLGGDPGRLGFVIHETKDRPADSVAAGQAVEILSRRTDRPLLLVVSFTNPHDIYLERPGKDGGTLEQPDPTPHRKALLDAPLPTSLADDLSGKPRSQRTFRDEDQGAAAHGWGEEEWRLYRYRYHLLVEKVDGEIGRVLDALQRRDGEPIVVFSSDHGDFAGAHGLIFKGPAMYEELVRVPLIILAPGVKTGESNALVSLIDVLPTLCDLAGIVPPTGVDGLSLSTLLGRNVGRLRPGAVRMAPEGGREAVVVEYFGKQSWRVPIRMVRTERWKFVHYLRGGEELYDLARDPHEIDNLADIALHANIRQTMSRILEDHLKSTGDPFTSLGLTDRKGQPIR